MTPARFCAWCIASLLMPGTAWAYIDPGVGSIMLQTLIGGAAAAAAAIALYWRQIKDTVLRRRKKPPPDPEDSENS